MKKIVSLLALLFLITTAFAQSGTFAVTTQNAPNEETWSAYEIRTITWDVAGTDQPPVNCSIVNVLLSLDGGINFPIVLAAHTANDGSEDITVLNLSTAQARIKVEASDHSFFAVSDVDFKVNSTLPVTWLSFTVQKLTSGSVLLTWSTANEFHNKNYTVQRSSDGINFSSITQVAAGNNPTGLQQYSVTDYKALTGINYYRLQQTDADGRSSFSALAKVILTQDGLTWNVQPNPAKNTTTFYVRKNLSNVTINIANASGKIVFSLKRNAIDGGENIFIPLTDFAKGIYFINVSSTEERRSEKLLIE